MDPAGNVLFSDPTSPQVFVIDSDNGQIVVPSATGAGPDCQSYAH